MIRRLGSLMPLDGGTQTCPRIAPLDGCNGDDQSLALKSGKLMNRAYLEAVPGKVSRKPVARSLQRKRELDGVFARSKSPPEGVNLLRFGEPLVVSVDQHVPVEHAEHAPAPEGVGHLVSDIDHRRGRSARAPGRSRRRFKMRPSRWVLPLSFGDPMICARFIAPVLLLALGCGGRVESPPSSTSTNSGIRHLRRWEWQLLLPSGSPERCTGATNIALNEWNLDWYATYVDPCTDCAYLTAASPPALPGRVLRGGNFGDAASRLLPSVRNGTNPSLTDSGLGFRCARSP
jgi:hypothetical protein